MKASTLIYKNLYSLFDSHIYPLIKPESSKTDSYLVYTIINTNPESTLDGYTGHEMAYIQLDIYTKSYDTCEDLTNKTIEILNNLNPFYYEGRQYLYENDTKLYRQSLDCHLWQSQFNDLIKDYLSVGDEEQLIGDESTLATSDYQQAKQKPYNTHR